MKWCAAWSAQLTEYPDKPMSDTEDKETAPDPQPERNSAGGGGVAWLALLLSVAALVAVGYTIYEDWRTQQTLALDSGNIEASLSGLSGRIDATNSAVAGTPAELDALGQADASLSSKVDLLESDISERLRLLDSLPIRISSTEAALATLQGVSAGARDTWLLGEAEYYMQLANAQLQLASNPELAILALGMADDRVAQLANPALTNVRIAIADEVASLNGMSTPDIAGITLKLASLARVVESLPLRPIERIEDEASEVTDEEVGRLDRAWNSVKIATSGLIKHRTTDEEVMPLISPEAEYFLRTNLALQMQTARLALLRGEQQVFEESLSDAVVWLELYFDANSAQVGAAIDSINELHGGMFATETPDISGSLRLLRQYNSVAETVQ
jgi:uroporphyrin-3 C-methyltransferase